MKTALTVIILAMMLAGILLLDCSNKAAPIEAGAYNTVGVER